MKVKSTIEIIVTLAILGLVYYFLRLPTSQLPLAFYDDGEILYHVLAALKGLIPYKDDINHHFLGYILPYIALSKITGFSPELARSMGFVNQITLGLGVFLILRISFGYWWSLLGGLLALSAREPWVLGTFVQYQIALYFVYVLLLALKGLQRQSIYFLYSSAVLAGFALLADQRALLIAPLPICAYFLLRKKWSWSEFCILKSSYLIFPFTAVLFLYHHNALVPFLEQTLIYPFKYRIGNKDAFDKIWDIFVIHKYLFSLTPFLLVAGCLGVVSILYFFKKNSDLERACNKLLLISFPLVFIMSSLGGRDFDYYTIFWLPILAIAAIHSSSWLPLLRTPLKIALKALLTAPILFSLLAVPNNIPSQASSLPDDGINEIVSYLKSNMEDRDTIYVWGYRLDLYVRLGRVSSSPFASRISINPDEQVLGQDREKNIDPKYQQLFFQQFKSSPPTYLVLFRREGHPHFDSPADAFIHQTIESGAYRHELKVEKKDFLGKTCTFEIYKLVK